MSAQFTASGYPNHAGTESPAQAGALHREGEQSPADFMDTSLQGSVDQAVGQARARTHLPYQHIQGLASHGLCCCQFFWGEPRPRGAVFHPEAARDFIHTPFAFPLTLESWAFFRFGGFFLNLGVLKVTFWFTFGVAT